MIDRPGARPARTPRSASGDAATSGFPRTRYSVVLATGSADARLRREAWDALVRAYWKPVYKYVRIVWRTGEDDAADRTQAFFARALEADFFSGYDPSKARFRTYLRVVLQRWLANEHKAAKRLKRGGDVTFVSLDFPAAERELQNPLATTAEPDAFFRQETIRSLFGLAVEDLRRLCDDAGKQIHFQVFERYDLHPASGDSRPTYREVADAFGLPITQVTNYLAFARRELRRLVLEHLRTMTGTDAEFREEALDLFGVEP